MTGFVQFKTKGLQDTVISGRGEYGSLRSILGPLSAKIIEASEQNNVVLVFGQGDLNLTPLIASVFLESKSAEDILIGIPRNKYNQLNRRYYENYFSLIRGNSRFSYKNTLWCSVREKKNQIDNGGTVFDLDNIKFRPKWGTKRYKNDIETSISEELKDGSINKRSFIVTFPLNIGFEDLILDNTSLNFSNKEYKLRSIVPKLIILESVNDTMYTVEPVIPLVNYLLENEISAVIHFSWPYINGLDRLFQAKNALSPEKRERLKTFHFGKRFSYELKDFVVSEILSSTREVSLSSAIKSHPSIEQLSLEGANWESYYPSTETIKSQNIIFCIPVNNLNYTQTKYDWFNHLTTNDLRIRELKENLSNHSLPDRWMYLFRFMPFVDSFVPPTSLKYLYQFDDGAYRKIDLLDAMSELKKSLKDSDIYLLESVAGIISSLSETLHMCDYLCNLKTPPINTKYSTVISYILKSLFEESALNIIICEYNTSFGFKKYMTDYLSDIFEYIKLNLPFSYDKLLKNDLILFSQHDIFVNGEIINKEIFKFDIKKNILHQSFEIKAEIRTKIKNEVMQKRVTITLESIDSLYRNFNYYDLKNVTLLLPGPLPIVRFDGNVPSLSKGIDLFLRPIKKIIIFVNQGENYIRAKEQIESIRESLFGEQPNRITEKDLQLSYNMNDSIRLRNEVEKAFEIHEKTGFQDSWSLINNSTEIQNTLDESILEKYLENEELIDKENFKTLKDVWNTISTSKKYVPKALESYNNEEYVQVRVQYERSGIEETISFRKGTYVRLIDAEDREIILAESLESGQKIAYLESDTKESLDNYFIRNYSSYSGITIEEVYEPFKCLSIFYNTLSRMDFSKNYSESEFKSLYWLSETERYQLYERIRFLMEVSSEETRNEEYIREIFKDSLIWESLSDLSIESLNRVKQVFESNKRLDMESLYRLAQLFGLNYTNESFKSLINTLMAGQSKYFFLDEENLLAVAKVINYRAIAENYETLTAAGKNIRTVLQQVGKSLRRVVSGNKRYLSDMDLLIEQKVMICTTL